MEVVGFKKVDFEAPDHTQISGFKVHCTLEDDNVTGVACESFFISEKKANGWRPNVGDEIELSYNKYGKIDRVEVA